jgi:hypothetical protein
MPACLPFDRIPCARLIEFKHLVSRDTSEMVHLQRSEALPLRECFITNKK